MVDASGKRAVARCDALGIAPYSAYEDRLYRGYLTPAHAATVDQVANWMTEAGMTPRLDSIGNLIGRYEGVEPDAPTLIIGSHIDSVHDAGFYDGPLGVMLGIECIAALRAKNRRLPFGIEVIAFGDEEGSRFPVSMICSGAIADFLPEDALSICDSDGICVSHALVDFKKMTTLNLPDGEASGASQTGRKLIGYLEAHIEQGPLLDNKDLAIGAVLGIASQLRFQFEVLGNAGHAGTTSMDYRKDALVGAAEIVLLTEKIARKFGPDVVATVGKMEVNPGAINVIPGLVTLSLDVRSLDQDLRDTTAKNIMDQATILMQNRGLNLNVSQLQDLPASPCDTALTKGVMEAISNTCSSQINLVSGAGHDAMVVAHLCPTAMLFIRCKDGISHNPAESVRPDDAEKALAAMLEFIDILERQNGS